MFTKFFHLFVALFFIFGSWVSAQDHSWSIALKSSYFGDQSRNSQQVTAIDKPISLGVELQYFLKNDVALQFSVENMSGKTQNPPGDELNVQSSLALVAYPVAFGILRPYLMQGILWGRNLNSNAAKSKNKIYFDFGLGTEIFLTGNVFSSFAVKSYSSGIVYHGWATSVSFGFRL